MKKALGRRIRNRFFSLLSSDDVEDRRFGISKILEIRNGDSLGSKGIREVFTPRLNWDAKSLRNLHEWDNATEPLQTASIPSSDLWKLLETPLQLPNVLCHTQSCERAVKEVSRLCRCFWSRATRRLHSGKDFFSISCSNQRK